MQEPPAAEYCSRELNGSQPAAHWQYTIELSCCETRTQGITAIWEKNPKFCAQLQLTRSYTYWKNAGAHGVEFRKSVQTWNKSIIHWRADNAPVAMRAIRYAERRNALYCAKQLTSSGCNRYVSPAGTGAIHSLSSAALLKIMGAMWHRTVSNTRIGCKSGKCASAAASSYSTEIRFSMLFQEDLRLKRWTNSGVVPTTSAMRPRVKRCVLPMNTCGNRFCTSGLSAMIATWLTLPLNSFLRIRVLALPDLSKCFEK